jgi:hypothetical protein
MAPLVLLDTDTLSEVMKGKDVTVEKNARPIPYVRDHPL